MTSHSHSPCTDMTRHMVQVHRFSAFSLEKKQTNKQTTETNKKKKNRRSTNFQEQQAN